MDVLGAAMRAAEIHFVEREGRIRHHDGGKPQIARRACSRLDRIVGADANDHQVRDTARVQPALEASVDEGIGDILLNHVLIGQWMEAGLEFNTGLAWCEDGGRLAADVADADDRVPCRPPGRMQPGDRVFGGRIVPGWECRGLHALLHVDNDQGWWLGHADSP
jgi:hypothetical protein